MLFFGLLHNISELRFASISLTAMNTRRGQKRPRDDEREENTDNSRATGLDMLSTAIEVATTTQQQPTLPQSGPESAGNHPSGSEPVILPLNVSTKSVILSAIPAELLVLLTILALAFRKRRKGREVQRNQFL